MNPHVFLLLNLALAFYNVGTIWAHEVDIFRSWKLIDPTSFPKVQAAHWRKLPFWVFVPVGASLLGSVALAAYHPIGSPLWCIWGVLVCQILSLGLTAMYWGRWQAGLSQDPLASRSPYLARILGTHWVRTVLVNSSAFILLFWTVAVLAKT